MGDGLERYRSEVRVGGGKPWEPSQGLSLFLVLLVTPGRNKGIRAVGDELEKEVRVWGGQRAAVAERPIQTA